MKKRLTYLAIGFGLTAFSGTASAVTSSCALIQSEISSGICTGTCIASSQQSFPECFGNTSSTASTTQEIRSTAIQQMLAVSNAISARTLPTRGRPEKVADSAQRFGLAAGSPAAQWNFWGSVSGDKNKYDRGGYASGGATLNNTSSTNVTNVVIGGDYQLAPTVALGVSAAFDSSSGTAQSFNNGALNTTTNNSTRGYTVAPYVGWQINQDWALDASLGVGRVNLDSSGTKGKANRLFYGTNLSYDNWQNNWQLTGKASYLHGEEKYGDLTASTGALVASTATNNKIDQLRVGAQAGYWLNDNAMPYFGLTYASDVSRSTSIAAQPGTEIGKNAVVWALGVNFFSLKNSVTGGLSYNQETGRTYAKNNSLMANINFRY